MRFLTSIIIPKMKWVHLILLYYLVATGTWHLTLLHYRALQYSDWGYQTGLVACLSNILESHIIVLPWTWLKLKRPSIQNWFAKPVVLDIIIATCFEIVELLSNSINSLLYGPDIVRRFYIWLFRVLLDEWFYNRSDTLSVFSQHSCFCKGGCGHIVLYFLESHVTLLNFVKRSPDLLITSQITKSILLWFKCRLVWKFRHVLSIVVNLLWMNDIISANRRIRVFIMKIHNKGFNIAERVVWNAAGYFYLLIILHYYSTSRFLYLQRFVWAWARTQLLLCLVKTDCSWKLITLKLL